MKSAADRDRPADELVTEPANETEKTEDDAPKMTRGGECLAVCPDSRRLRLTPYDSTPTELASILRGGASALARWGGEEGSDPFSDFRDATFAELRERGKERDEKKEVGIKLDIGEEVTEEQRRQMELEEEEAEKLLLQGREAVQARKFEGSTYKATVSSRARTSLPISVLTRSL